MLTRARRKAAGLSPLPSLFENRRPAPQPPRTLSPTSSVASSDIVSQFSEPEQQQRASSPEAHDADTEEDPGNFLSAKEEEEDLTEADQLEPAATPPDTKSEAKQKSLAESSYTSWLPSFLKPKKETRQAKESYESEKSGGILNFFGRRRSTMAHNGCRDCATITTTPWLGRKDSRSLQDFLQEFNDESSLRHWSDARCIEVFPNVVRGEAREAWHHANKKGKTWKEKIDAFAAMFPTALTQAELFMMKQKEGQTVTEFSSAIRKAVHELYGENNKKAAIDAFVNGLRGKVKGRLLFKNYDSLDEATNAAIATDLKEARLAKDAEQEAMLAQCVATLQVSNQEQHRAQRYDNANYNYPRRGYPSRGRGFRRRGGHRRQHNRRPEGNHNANRSNDANRTPLANRGGSRFMARAFVSTLFFMMIVKGAGANNVVVRDCNRHTHRAIAARPEKQSCEMLPQIFNRTQATLYVPQTREIILPSIECSRVNSSYQLTRAFGQTIAGSLKGSSKMPCSIDEVQQFKSDGMISDVQFFQEKLDVWKSSVVSTPAVLPTFGRPMVNTTYFEVRRSAVRTVNHRHMKSLTLQMNDDCEIMFGNCTSGNFIVLWTPPDKLPCPFEKVGIFTALLANDFVLLEEPQAAFKLLNGSIPVNASHCIPKKAKQASNGVFLVMEDRRRKRQAPQQNLRAPPGQRPKPKQNTPANPSPEAVIMYFNPQPELVSVQNQAAATPTSTTKTAVPPSTTTTVKSTTTVKPTTTVKTTTTGKPTTRLKITATASVTTTTSPPKTTTSKPSTTTTRATVPTTFRPQASTMTTTTTSRPSTTTIKTMPATQTQVDRRMFRRPLPNVRVPSNRKMVSRRSTPEEITIQDLEDLAVIRWLESVGFAWPARIPEAMALMDAYNVSDLNTFAPNTQTNNLINSRLQYVWEREQLRSARDFATLWNNICELHNRDIETVLALLAIDTEAAVRKWFRTHDVTGKFVGEALEVAYCDHVTPQNIYWNLSYAGVCYELPPAIVDGKIRFVHLQKQELVNSAAVRPCTDGFKSVRKLHNGSYTDGKSLINVIEVAKIEAPKPHRSDEMISAKSPFQSDLNGIVSTISLMERYINRFNDRPVLPMVYGGSNAWDALATVISMAGSVANATIDLTAGVTSFVESPLKALKDFYDGYQLLVRSVVITVVVIAMLILTRSCWWPMVRRVCRTSRHERRRQKVKQAINAITEVGYHPQEAAVMLKMARREEKPFIRDYIPSQAVYGVIRGKQPHIEVRVKGHKVKALVDTGATITYCRESTAKMLNVKVQDPRPDDIAKTANNTLLSFAGRCEIPIQLNNRVVNVQAKVSRDRDCPAPMLIGMDTLKATSKGDSFAIDFDAEKLKFGGTHFDMVNTIPSFVMKVKAVEETVLEPNSESVFMAAVVDGKMDEVYLTTSTDAKIPEQALLGKSVATVDKNGQIPVRMLNAGKSPVIIRRHQTIGCVEPVDDDEVMEEAYFVQDLGNNYVPPEADIIDELPQFPSEKNKKKIAVNLDNSVLSPNAKKTLKEVIERNAEAFVGEDGIIGRYKGEIKHEIPLTEDHVPFRQRPYQIPQALKTEVQRQIEDMLKQRIIEPSTSPFASPIILVKKKDGTYRFAVDYRKLNAITRKHSYNLPLISEIVDQVGGKRYYSTFDMQSGFHQIDVAPEHRERTAFTTFLGLFHFLRMPFGLCGAPHTFQRVMEAMKRELTASFFVYLDDIVLASAEEEEHVNDIENLLKLFIKYGLKLRADKCAFGQKDIKYLGFRINEDGIRPDQDNVKAVMNLQRPKSLTELRSLIGAFTYFRRFIPKFAELMAPLTELTKATRNVDDWSDQHEKALTTVKELLCKAPVLAPPRFGKPFVVETDASKVAIAACLLQEHDGQLHPIAYASRKLNKHEANYPSVESEALAVVFGLKMFRPYLEGAGTSKVVTDNSALVALLRRKDLTGRLAKYQMAIQGMDILTTHRPGKQNVFCDHLSRHIAESVNAVAVPKAPLVDRTRLLQAQKDDSETATLLANPEKPFAVVDDLLMWRGRSARKARMCIPTALRKEIFENFHAHPAQGAHLGVAKTTKRLMDRVQWKGMQKDIQEWIKSCVDCARHKTQPSDRHAEPLKPLEVPSQPMERLNTDILGPLPETVDGNKYVLVTVCGLTKFVIATPMPDQTAPTVVQALIKDVYTKYGNPKTLISDNGRQFTSAAMKDLAKVFGYEHVFTTPYHPQSNGAVERQNRTLAAMISNYVNSNGSDWDSQLPHVVFSYNTSVHEATGEVPFAQMFLRHPRLPSDNALDTKSMEGERTLAAAKQTWRTAQKALERAAARMKLKTDTARKAEPRRYQPGDQCMLKDNPIQGRHKFANKWSGPFTIETVSGHNLTLGTPKGQKVVHKDQTKPYLKLS